VIDFKRWLPHVGVAVGVFIALYALFFSTSDEDAIRAQLEALQTAVRVTPDDTNIVVRAARTKGAFAEIFIKEVSYEIPELAHATGGGRTELAMLAANAPQLWREARVDLGALAIDIDQAGMSAVAYGEAHLVATRQGGDLERDSRTVSLRFDKIDDDWRIVSLSASPKEGAAPVEGLDE
jgi:hypothetical protein